MSDNKELTALTQEQEQEFMGALYNFVMKVASDSDKASPAELCAMPEIAALIAYYFVERM